MTMLTSAERIDSPDRVGSPDCLGSGPSGQEPRSATLPDPAALPLERVEAELCTLAGQIAAATCRFLRLLADFDAREGWAGWQVKSCAHWLSWRCGMDLRTAREQVRVARALADLPQVGAAFAAGRLSYSKVRALTRVARPETEADLVDAALHAPAAQVERLLRGLQTAQEPKADRRDRMGVRWRWDDDGSLVIWGRLVPDEGARLLAGLTRLDQERDAAPDPNEPAADGSAEHQSNPGSGTKPDGSAEHQSNPGSGTKPDGSAEHLNAAPDGAGSAEHPDSGGRVDDPEEPARSGTRVLGGPPSDLGPALVAAGDLACSSVPVPVHAPGAEVVVHVDVDTFVAGARQDQDESADQQLGRQANPQPGRLDDGPALTAATVQMLACDGRIQLSVDGPDGRTLDLGQRRRRPTNRQIVALWRRDRGCAVPGCGRTHFLHAHHVRPWALGGRTSLDNLVLLCREHHRLLHDGGFAIAGCGRQRFRFFAPHGSRVREAPAITGEAADLVATHPDVGPTTIEPEWDGSDLHLHEAVSAYLTGWQNRSTKSTGRATPPKPPTRPSP